MGKKKKRKINKRKFLSRIFLLIVIITLIIVAFKNLTKKEEKTSDITIIINNENITSTLINRPYITKVNDIYFSMEDIRNLFDKNICYEEQTDKILITSETKSAAIGVKANTIQINSASLSLENQILEYGETFYIPISEISSIYNIEYSVTQDSAVINSLYKELITIKPTKKISLKESPRIFCENDKKT